MLFSKEVLALYDEIRDADDPIERAELMLELAETFVADTDDTDPQLGEDIHDFITEVIRTKMIYERKTMALARVIMRSLPSYVEDHLEPEKDDTSQAN